MLKVGFGKCKITPSIGGLFGDSSRINSYIEDIKGDLFVKVIYFTNAKDTTCVLAMADIAGFTLKEDRRMRKAMAKAIGVSPDLVRVNATHTHTAPHTYTVVHNILSKYNIPFTDTAWVDEIEKAFIKAAVDAKKKAVPVTVYGGISRVRKVGANRTVHTKDGNICTRFGYTDDKLLQDAPEGLIDPDVTVLQFRNAEGRPVVNLFNYACHMTSLACRGSIVSADIAGFASDIIENKTEAPAFFLQGACGNVGTGKYSDGSFEAAKKMARSLTGAVMNTLDNLYLCESDSFTYKNWEEQIDLDSNLPSESDVLKILEQKIGKGVKNTSLWKYAALLEVIRNRDSVRRCQLFYLKSKDWCILGLPAESFVESALAI